MNSKYPWEMLPCFPMTIENFLSEEEQELFLNYLGKNEPKFGQLVSGDFWEGRTLTVQNVGDPIVKKSLLNVRHGMMTYLRTAIEKHLGPQGRLYSDLINFARWPVGYELHPHADMENPPGHPEHPYPWRHFGAVVYINDDYEGGNIHFPNLSIEFKPKARSLNMFPGTLHYLHGVRPVTSGMRHTIASFLTFDKNHHDNADRN